MNNLNNSLELSKVYKRLGQSQVLKDISLTILPHSINIITGPNGSGKTTLLKIAARLMCADQGSILHSPHTPLRYIGNTPGLYGKLTVAENIAFFLSNPTLSQDDLPAAFKAWNIERHRNTPVEKLSKGQQMRVALMIAMLSKDSLLILDEPTAFLDDEAVEVFVRFLVENSNKNTFLIATHDQARIPIDKFSTSNLRNGEIS